MVDLGSNFVIYVSHWLRNVVHFGVLISVGSYGSCMETLGLVLGMIGV